MAPADSVAKSIAAHRLVAFAAKQSAVATPTADRGLARASSIGRLGAAVRAAATAHKERAPSSLKNGADGIAVQVDLQPSASQ